MEKIKISILKELTENMIVDTKTSVSGSILAKRLNMKKKRCIKPPAGIGNG